MIFLAVIQTALMSIPRKNTLKVLTLPCYYLSIVHVLFREVIDHHENYFALSLISVYGRRHQTDISQNNFGGRVIKLRRKANFASISKN